MGKRVIEVDPERLDRWLAGFSARHGPFDAIREDTADGVVLRARAADGASVEAEPFAHDPLGIVLVRRGGYAAGLALAGTLTATKVGSRHVQSRTAAGGWSQQRFARRRGKQADELVDAVVRHARRILLGDDESPRQDAKGLPTGWSWAATGHSRARCWRHLRCARCAACRCARLYDLPDPKRDVLETALRRGRAYRVTLTEPDSAA